MTYAIYRLIETGIPRGHHALFVETLESGPLTSYRYHVIGNIQEGMTFEDRPTGAPEDEPMFASKELLGHVAVNGYARFMDVCLGVPVPRKQFQGVRRLYPSEPVRRCQEWADEAVTALEREGVLVRRME